ncbi:MAG: SDR family oxidoreductase [Dehalococcoidia bacterium]
MRALVTGGSGFIGSHLVTLLLEQGHEVRVVDNYATGRLSNLAHLVDAPGLRVIQADVADADLTEAFADVDWVFHLAALADIVPSIERPVDYYTANVTGTVRVLEAARAAGVGRVVYAASSSCYGIPDAYPTPEDAPARPQYPYALTKYLGEQCVLHWAQCYGLPAVSLRLFNVYGPRARTSGTYGAVFGVFLAQRLHGKPLTIVGDGTQTRDFTFVTDVARAFLAAAESEVSGEAINVGSGGTYAVNRIAELIGGERVHIPKRPGEPDCTFADTSKAARLLGWRASVPLETGVGTLLAGIEEFREAPVWEQASIAQATKAWFQHLGREAVAAPERPA